jgi:hypothetical protein
MPKGHRYLKPLRSDLPPKKKKKQKPRIQIISYTNGAANQDLQAEDVSTVRFTDAKGNVFDVELLSDGLSVSLAALGRIYIEPRSGNACFVRKTKEPKTR